MGRTRIMGMTALDHADLHQTLHQAPVFDTHRPPPHEFTTENPRKAQNA